VNSLWGGVASRKSDNTTLYWWSNDEKSRRVKLLGLLSTSSVKRVPSVVEPVHFCVHFKWQSIIKLSSSTDLVFLEYFIKSSSLCVNKPLEVPNIVTTADDSQYASCDVHTRAYFKILVSNRESFSFRFADIPRCLSKLFRAIKLMTFFWYSPVNESVHIAFLSRTNVTDVTSDYIHPPCSSRTNLRDHVGSKALHRTYSRTFVVRCHCDQELQLLVLDLW